MSFLYNITIYPIELALKALFEFLIYVSGNYGFSLIALSFLITIFCIPLRRLAANLHQREKQVHEIMAPQMAQIKANKKGRERQEAINRLYRRYSYHPLLALRSSFGILNTRWACRPLGFFSHVLLPSSLIVMVPRSTSK